MPAAAPIWRQLWPAWRAAATASTSLARARAAPSAAAATSWREVFGAFVVPLSGDEAVGPASSKSRRASATASVGRYWRVRAYCSASGLVRLAGVVQPLDDLGGVEPYEMTDLDMRNAIGRLRVNGHLDLPSGGHDNSPRTVTTIPQGRTAGLPGDGHRRAPGTATVPVLAQARGTTPLPAMASAKRTDWPSVRTTWAWCNNRSTRAEAMVLSINSSKPEGWMLVERANERFS